MNATARNVLVWPFDSSAIHIVVTDSDVSTFCSYYLFVNTDELPVVQDIRYLVLLVRLDHLITILERRIHGV